MVSTGQYGGQYRSVWWSVLVSVSVSKVSVIVSTGQCGGQYRSVSCMVQVSVVVSTGQCSGQYRSRLRDWVKLLAFLSALIQS